MHEDLYVLKLLSGNTVLLPSLQMGYKKLVRQLFLYFAKLLLLTQNFSRDRQYLGSDPQTTHIIDCFSGYFCYIQTVPFELVDSAALL
jgi:hypothetical protein